MKRIEFNSKNTNIASENLSKLMQYARENNRSMGAVVEEFQNANAIGKAKLLGASVTSLEDLAAQFNAQVKKTADTHTENPTHGKYSDPPELIQDMTPIPRKPPVHLKSRSAVKNLWKK